MIKVFFRCTEMQHATRPTKFAKLAMSVKNFTYCAYRKLKSDILDTRKYSTVSDEEEKLSLDSIEKSIVGDGYILPSEGHRVFVLQPDIRWIAKNAKITNANLQLAEACALIESLPKWSVAEKMTVPLRHDHKKHLFGTGKLEELTATIQSRRNEVTAVFVSVDILSGLQLATLQQAWHLPVYDRYTIVLQIFRVRAKTKEAKIQVALAEMPYFRSRLKGMHDGSLEHQQGGLSSVGGSGERFRELRKRIIEENELKLKNELEVIRKNRDVLKKQRAKREIPVVAIVGYTNAGKTSLIKALTGESTLVPRDQLFATLDVTVHAGQLPSHRKVLYVDTVGFISDIPTALVASFKSTLEDAIDADVIVHVRDISHPDAANQRHCVLDTLGQLELTPAQVDNVIEVCNKADLVQRDSNSKKNDNSAALYVSATTGQGLTDLVQALDKALMTVTGRVTKRLKVPQNGPHLSWLYKEASVKSAEPAPNDPESLLVEVVFTAANYAKFVSHFAKKKKQ